MHNIIAYCDGLIPRSEVGFMRRQYESFDELKPHWLARLITPDARDLTAEPLLLGRPGPAGDVERILFNQLGRIPSTPNLAALAPRLIHAQFGRGGALALPLASELGIPLAVTFHGGDANKHKHYRWRFPPTVFQRRLAALKREASLFVCVSHSIRARLLSRGFPEDKLMVVNIGIDLPPLIESTPRHMLFVGRFVEKKGVFVLIEAARLLRGQGCLVPLILVGDGPLFQRAKRDAAGLAEVQFRGWQDNAVVRGLMASAVAVCVPSVRAADGDAEGLPTVAMEAMSAGVPVIGTDEAGLDGLIEDNINGRIVRARDAQGFAIAMGALAGDLARRREIGLAGRALAERRLSAAQQSRRLQELFLGLIERRRAD